MEATTSLKLSKSSKKYLRCTLPMFRVFDRMNVTIMTCHSLAMLKLNTSSGARNLSQIIGIRITTACMWPNRAHMWKESNQTTGTSAIWQLPACRRTTCPSLVEVQIPPSILNQHKAGNVWTCGQLRMRTRYASCVDVIWQIKYQQKLSVRNASCSSRQLQVVQDASWHA